MKIFIKESNYWALHDAFFLNRDERVQGTKLIALNRLIDKKGILLNTGNEKIKGIEISKGTFIAMQVTPLKKDSFFPCKIRKFHLQQLNLTA